MLGLTATIGTFAGDSGDVAVIDPRRAWTVTPGNLLSRSKNSSFLGRTFTGRVVQTYLRGVCACQVV